MDGRVTLSTTGTLAESITSQWFEDLKTSPAGHHYAASELDGLRVTGNGNDAQPANLVITFAGLSAGTYTMDILSGFYGKDGLGGNMTFALSGSGTDVTGVSWNSSLCNNNANGIWTDGPAASGGILTSGSVFQNNTLVNRGVFGLAEGIVVEEGGTLVLTVSCNSGYYPSNVINNITLTNNVPESASASLGVLALGSLLMRRKRS